MDVEFKPFDKLTRLSRDVVITEKLDGTNAQVYIRELADSEVMPTHTPIVAVVGKFLLYAGSRNRWITPEADNYGFAAWVRDNADQLVGLGQGRHYGEWYGAGIQRRYGLTEKRFALFNVQRWGRNNDKLCTPPECCHTVPVMYKGLFDTDVVNILIEKLKLEGSIAVPGFMDPEGIVIWHTACNIGFKKTCKNDDKPKSLVQPNDTVSA